MKNFVLVFVLFGLYGCTGNIQNIPQTPEQFQKPAAELLQTYPEIKKYHRSDYTVKMGSLIKVWGEPDSVKQLSTGLEHGIYFSLGTILWEPLMTAVVAPILYLAYKPEKLYTWNKDPYVIQARGRENPYEGDVVLKWDWKRDGKSIFTRPDWDFLYKFDFARGGEGSSMEYLLGFEYRDLVGDWDIQLTKSSLVFAGDGDLVSFPTNLVILKPLRGPWRVGGGLSFHRKVKIVGKNSRDLLLKDGTGLVLQVDYEKFMDNGNLDLKLEYLKLDDYSGESVNASRILMGFTQYF